MAPFRYNHPVLKPRRQELRVRQTIEESLLWERLRDRQINNFKFYRQYSVGPYILDFYCSKARLAVELDGHHHESAEYQKYDEERSDYLAEEDIRVVRFKNEEVLKNADGVISKIRALVVPFSAPLP